MGIKIPGRAKLNRASEYVYLLLRYVYVLSKPELSDREIRLFLINIRHTQE